MSALGAFLPGERGVIEVTSSKVSALNFLQSLVTTDALGYSANGAHPVYSAMLNPQGRFLFDFFLHFSALGSGDDSADCGADCGADDSRRVYLETKAEWVQGLAAKLKAYNLRGAVGLKVLGQDEYSVFVRDANALFACLYDGLSLCDKGGAALRGIALGEDGRAALGEMEDINMNWYHGLRVQNCVPDGFLDMTQGRSVILEYRFDEMKAVSFTKGCYIGQEFITRTKHLGVVRKRLFAMKLEPGAGGPKGQPLDVYQGEKKAGALLSMFGDCALAIINTELSELDKGFIGFAAGEDSGGIPLQIVRGT